MTTVKKSTILSNPWVVGIGTTVLAAGVLKLIDVVADTRILSALGNFFGMTGNLFVSLWGFFEEKHQLPTWLIILLPLSIPILLALLFWIVVSIPTSKPKDLKDKNPHKIYTSDVFKGILFQWEWSNFDDFIYVGRISVYCPTDECILVNKRCPVCETDYGKVDYSDEEIKVLINYYVENNKWEDRYKNSPVVKRKHKERLERIKAMRKGLA